MCLLAEAAARVGDRPHAATLYTLLLPYADRVTISYTEISVGPVSRHLGLLAGVTGNPDAAAHHLRQACHVASRIGARPWLAHAQRDYAGLRLPGERPAVTPS